MNSSLFREATHAGSWYTSNANQLNHELEQWMSQAKKDIQEHNQIKAIIGPFEQL